VQLKITSYASPASSVVIADGTSGTPFALIADSISWGNANFEHAYSAPRGTLGRKPAAGIVQNRDVSLPVRVYGTSKTNLATNLQTLGAVIDDVRQFGGRLSWKSAGQAYQQHLEVLGTNGANLAGWNNRAEQKSIAQVDISFVCAPYASGDPMDIVDSSFASFSTDYTVWNGSSALLSVSGATLGLASSSSSEFAIMHNQNGYTVADAEVIVKATYSQSNGFQVGGVVWGASSSSYVKCVLSDTGSASTLSIQTLASGSFTTNATTSPTRPANGATVWVRSITQGTTVIVEYWTSEPTPLGTPANTTSYTASTPIVGNFGAAFKPLTITPVIDSVSIKPFTYQSNVLPAKLSLASAIPGDAPALAQVQLTTKQSLTWALLAWQEQTAASSLGNGATSAFAVRNGNSHATVTGWAADSTNASVKTTSATTGTTYAAEYALDPSLLPADAYADGDRAIEVWALVHTDTGAKLVSPKIVASVKPATGPGPVRYTDEWGSSGRNIPTMGTGASTGFRWTRLGTIHLPYSAAREMRLVLSGTVSAGSSGGTFGVARIVTIPVRQRACLPTNKDCVLSPSTYPAWTANNASPTVETVKTVDSDLGTSVYQPSVSTVPVSDRSMSGSTLELPAGMVDLLVVLSALEPDDPGLLSSTATEYVATGSPSASTVPQAAVHVSVIPRFGQLRS